MIRFHSKLLFATALSASLALASGAVLAQDTATPSADATGSHHHMPSPEQQLAHLTKKLGLSSDQQAKIGPILQSRDQQIAATHQDTSLSPADRKTKMHTALQSSDDQINAVMTDVQRTQYLQLKDEKRWHQNQSE